MLRRRKPENRGKPWSDRDKELLDWFWGHKTIGGIARVLKRTPRGVFECAKKRGLKIGCPIGWVRLADFAVEVGFDRLKTLSILTTMRVMVRRGFSMLDRHKSRKYRRSLKRRFYFPIVERERAEAAVRAWLTWETVYDASKRLGLSHTYLKTLMVRAGYVPPPRNVKWRMPAAEFDAVVVAWRARTGSKLRPSNRGPRRVRSDEP